jgi:hypothetical protein
MRSSRRTARSALAPSDAASNRISEGAAIELAKPSPAMGAPPPVEDGAGVPWTPATSPSAVAVGEGVLVNEPIVLCVGPWLAVVDPIGLDDGVPPAVALGGGVAAGLAVGLGVTDDTGVGVGVGVGGARTVALTVYT